MRNWTIHVSVLRDLVCFLPGSGELACIEFIKWISSGDGEVVALDYDGFIFNDYDNLKNDPSIKESNLYKNWMKNILQTEGKIDYFLSQLPEPYRNILKSAEVSDNDIPYFCVAINADKLFAHSKGFCQKAINICSEEFEIVIYDIPENNWRNA